MTPDHSFHIMLCSALMDATLAFKDSVLQHIEHKNIEKITQDIQNKERLIKIIKMHIKKIDFFFQVYLKQKNESKLIFFSQWKEDLKKWILLCQKNDQIIERNLEQFKREIMGNISETHRIRKQLKGYNLNNVSR